jgi:hypothetical protein
MRKETVRAPLLRIAKALAALLLTTVLFPPGSWRSLTRLAACAREG